MSTTVETTTGGLAARPREAAKLIGISQRTLWTLTQRGEIPHTRLGRCVVYPIDALRAWLANRAGAGSREE